MGKVGKTVDLSKNDSEIFKIKKKNKKGQIDQGKIEFQQIRQLPLHQVFKSNQYNKLRIGIKF